MRNLNVLQAYALAIHYMLARPGPTGSCGSGKHALPPSRGPKLPTLQRRSKPAIATTSPPILLQRVSFRRSASPFATGSNSCHLIVQIGRHHGQTAAQAASSLASALAARGSLTAARRLQLGFAARAGRESVAATEMLWREAVAACPQAHDLVVQLHWHREWGGLTDALPG